MPTFDVVVVGSGGGPSELNISAQVHSPDAILLDALNRLADIW